MYLQDRLDIVKQSMLGTFSSQFKVQEFKKNEIKLARVFEDS